MNRKFKNRMFQEFAFKTQCTKTSEALLLFHLFVIFQGQTKTNLALRYMAQHLLPKYILFLISVTCIEQISRDALYILHERLSNY